MTRFGAVRAPPLFASLPRMTRAALLLGILVGCGARTGLNTELDAEVRPRPARTPEICNGLDDDLDVLDRDASVDDLDGGAPTDGSVSLDASVDVDLVVDEDFRDARGRYVHPDHCGGCDMPCRATSETELEVDCVVIDGAPVCAAVLCADGFAPSPTGRCVPLFDRLCMSCTDDGDCGDLAIAACDDVAGEQRCVVGCDFGCPDGYECTGDRCIPSGGSCNCQTGDAFDLACALRDPEGNRCPGSATCDDGVVSECLAPDEVCDMLDNDCDGTVDEAFRDARGAYILDIQHCGECGVDCTLSEIPEGDLVCGGDPFAPSCVLACPDAADGVMPGDRIDADLDIANGCECTVSSLDDVPGPVGAEGEDLDVNCDGADGVVVQSFYVAPDGDDRGPGSPTRPLRTLDVAVQRAAESMETRMPRPHVFVASGSYAETVTLRDGVRVHGGYRRDFLALDPSGFRVEVRAPAETEAPGGAALFGEGVGANETVVEWMRFRGRDAETASSAAFGAVLVDPGPRLQIRDAEIVSGVPGSGSNGRSGEVGAAPEPAEDGDLPRGAVEDAFHGCEAIDANVVEGGRGGANVCDGLDVSGGAGGSPSCPSFAEQQPNGRPGNGGAGGGGGRGGEDSMGPITGGPSCPAPPCCGLADFTVPTDFSGPQAGTTGGDGRVGTSGRGCSDAIGSFAGRTWTPADATGGTRGTAGSGGGGGGAGGGSEMTWFDGSCEFADGLGGGGGGGGAGGCGGDPGSPGTSGGPAAAILVFFEDDGPVDPPVFRGLTLRPADGGRGGDGGAGGDGGRGGAGGLGGELPRGDRSTPTLAGPFPGGRGGRGGNGGPGGGGGGGCGGGSVGIWATGTRTVPTTQWETENDFVLGAPGLGGQGGGGGAAGADGAEGGASDVLVR